MQWISSGFLFCSWLTQNIPNTSVYIPRFIDLYSLILFIILGISTIGFTIYNKGGPIQNIVNEKQLDVKVLNIHLTIGDKEYNCYDDELDIEEFSKTYYELMAEGFYLRLQNN